jgi:hypothetical protein
MNSLSQRIACLYIPSNELYGMSSKNVLSLAEDVGKVARREMSNLKFVDFGRRSDKSNPHSYSLHLGMSPSLSIISRY